MSCDFGFYADKWSGLCHECPKNLNCRTCSHYNFKYQDDWKWEIKNNYYYGISLGVGYPNYFVSVESPNRVEN